MSYPFASIEQKWQKKWQQERTFICDLDNETKPKAYLLDMFPYPSGSGLHVGHPRGYCVTDIMARYKLMQGYNVLHPIGWDAFGLPAEQYALNTGNDPALFTQQNIDRFRQQLQRLGFSFDYEKEINTTDPAYYRWTQWIFIQLYQQGLAKLEAVAVNFCPQLGTVLANEEVIIVNDQMVSERGHYPVIKKAMKQWVLKITHYAEKLLSGLKTVDWPQSIKDLQINWIGKTKGVLVDFYINDTTKITVFTTRVDTIYGVSFLALSCDHLLIWTITTKENAAAVQQYLQASKAKTDLMKQAATAAKFGVFTGSYAIHPFTKAKIPIWIADYVLSNYGTGAVMGVPDADNRDALFAASHNLATITIFKAATTTYLNSPLINGLSALQLETAKAIITKALVSLKQGQETVVYKLRDWLFSRQRYWGEPFPIIYWQDNTITTVDQATLPLILPKIKDIKPSQAGIAPLAKADPSWLEVIREDGVKGRREINTMPQWAGSCWYYLAYLLRKQDGYYDFNSAIAQKRFQHWLPVDLYVGGQEHAVLHLLYARFWHLVLYDLKLVPVAEPFFKLVNQGMILGSNNEKMSKSRGNVINPDDIINQYGADTLRIYEMFIGPIKADLPWKTSGLIGIHKFLTRIYHLYTNRKYQTKFSNDNNNTLIYLYHQTVFKVTNDIETLSFNTAIAQLMIFINECYKAEQLYRSYMINFLKLLHPFAPHLSAELFAFHHQTSSLVHAAWPTYDKQYLHNVEVVIAVQINGKTKATIRVLRDLTASAIMNIIKQDPKISQLLAKHTIKKTIYVPNKIINYVTN